MGLSAIKEHIIRTSVREALTNAQIPHDSPLAQQLQNEAEIAEGSRDAYVRASNGSSLQDRIEQLKTVPKFGVGIGVKPTVPSTDTAGIASNFDKIVSGEVVVK